MRLAALVAAAALAGCSSPPMIDGGAIACVRVDRWRQRKSGWA